MISLYIHFPFCLSKCPYCDFYSVIRSPDDENILFKAYERDLKFHAHRLGERQLSTIFFGGGTPSLMPASLVQNLINLATTMWTPSENIEITLEANPHTVDLQKFRSFKDVGINRLSLGIQSLRDDALKFLGRNHTRRDALHAIETSRQIFERTSFDLIYARPEQTLEQWREELSEALLMDPSHLSLYQLTIEEGTAFHTMSTRGSFVMPNEALSAAFYDMTQDMTLGLLAYEVSNHAQPGYESLHNLTYWRYKDYVGIGPGAHGRYRFEGQKWATSYPKNVDVWLKNESYLREETLDKKTQFSESVMMGLRLTEGVVMEKFSEFWECLNKQLTDLREAGYAIIDSGRLSLTKEGRKRHSAIVRLLLSSIKI